MLCIFVQVKVDYSYILHTLNIPQVSIFQLHSTREDDSSWKSESKGICVKRYFCCVGDGLWVQVWRVGSSVPSVPQPQLLCMDAVARQSLAVQSCLHSQVRFCQQFEGSGDPPQILCGSPQRGQHTTRKADTTAPTPDAAHTLYARYLHTGCGYPRPYLRCAVRPAVGCMFCNMERPAADGRNLP